VTVLLGAYVLQVMRDEVAAKYVDGIAVHWYWDLVDPAIGLDATHSHFPSKFILSSEASNGKYKYAVFTAIFLVL